MNLFESHGVSYKQALPPEDWPRINKYLSCLVIAKENGTTVNVAKYLRRIHDINKPTRINPNQKVFEADIQKMRELREQGYTCEQAGKILGFTANIVSTYAPGYARGRAM